jgi:hypothetical protein
MTRPRGSSIGAGVLLAIALVLAAVVEGRADVESDYSRGWTAYKQGNWKVVLDAMTAAIAQRPAEQGRINIGSNNNQPYLPHYYLGLARYRLGDCRGALGAWQESLTQGYVRRFRQENEEFSRYYPICEKQVEIETDLAAAQTALALLSELTRDPYLGPVWATDPALGPSVTKASAQLNAAKQDYEAAKREREQQRVSALTATRTMSAGLRKQVDTIERAARSLQQSMAEARRRQQQEETAAAARLAAQAAERQNAPAPTAPRAEGTPTGLAAVPPRTVPVPPRAGRPPDALRAGIERFANGRYHEALSALSTVRAGDLWDAQATLFRAAAMFSLYRATGEPQWRARAFDAARRSARLAPDLLVDERLLSPAFRRFYTDVTRGESTTALPTR